MVNICLSFLDRQNLPPYLNGWQEFKDYLRRIVKEQPGWADVYPSQTQRRGDMEGWCRLRDSQDADAAYRVFSKSRGMLIHVWETCRSSGDYRLMRCNCSMLFSELPSGTHSPGRCGIDIGRVHQLSGGSLTGLQTPYNTAQTAYGYGIHPPTSSYSPIPVYSMHASPSPIYSTSINGMPVNVRNGGVLTEARGIFIRNLSYKATPENLNQLLYTVGVPVDSQLLRDPRTGTFKGVATAKFGSKEEASYAAACLNGKEHMGMTLQVRMDTDITVVGRSEPVIVNGSFPGGVASS